MIHLADVAFTHRAARTSRILETRGRAGTTANGVRGVSFELADGEAAALIGPNGAGKSTLMQGLLGLVQFSSGAITIDGHTFSARSGNISVPRGTFAYLPQSFDLDKTFPITVEQFVMLGRFPLLGLFRWPQRGDHAAVRSALGAVQLNGLGNLKFGDLSGGQRQRALLARAIATKPRILLLDEPFNGLDEENRENLITILRKLKSSGCSVILSTHDATLAREVCETVVLLNGHQVASGPIDELLQSKDEPVRALLADECVDEHHAHDHHEHDHHGDLLHAHDSVDRPPIVG